MARECSRVFNLNTRLNQVVLFMKTPVLTLLLSGNARGNRGGRKQDCHNCLLSLARSARLLNSRGKET